MEGHPVNNRERNFVKRNFSEIQRAHPRMIDRHDHHHRFSEPKNKIKLIKINKNKLPVDFFQRKDSPVSQRHPSIQRPEGSWRHRKAESERLHYSPEKTSYFGSFTENDITPHQIASTNLCNRRFETRDEPKREAFPKEPPRKLATAAKNGKNEFLDLFPATHDTKLNEMIISSAKGRNLKLSPRKEWGGRGRQVQPFDPEKGLSGQQSGEKVEAQAIGREDDMLNMTFFKGKSTSFPPISRQ